MFHYFVLEEVYDYAEEMGYSREEVEVERVCVEYDYDREEEVAWEYEVSFGHEDSEMWVWQFDDLSEPACAYDHVVCED